MAEQLSPTGRRALVWAVGELTNQDKDKEAATGEARALLSFFMGRTGLDFLLSLDRVLTKDCDKAFQEGVARRRAGEPMQYILGSEFFLEREFLTQPGVLIPRRDTEALVRAALERLPEEETALPDSAEKLKVTEEKLKAAAEERKASKPAWARGRKALPEGNQSEEKESEEKETQGTESPQEGPGNLRPRRVLELGVGSGAVIGSLAAIRQGFTGVAVDLAPEALALAAENFRRLGVAQRIELRQGSWYEPVADGEGFDLILSNPPYITTGEMAELPEEVLAEPRLALWGGEDGLDCYRLIVPGAWPRLTAGGWLLVEIGWLQGPAVAELFRRQGFSGVTILTDGGGRDRVVLGQKR